MASCNAHGRAARRIATPSPPRSARHSSRHSVVSQGLSLHAYDLLYVQRPDRATRACALYARSMLFSMSSSRASVRGSAPSLRLCCARLVS